VRVGRAEYMRIVKTVQQPPEVINAYNVTGEDSWVLEIAVMDVAHLDDVVSRFCLLTETWADRRAAAYRRLLWRHRDRSSRHARRLRSKPSLGVAQPVVATCFMRA
jgi:DNA-binding Lrp family transcriptional regulator